MGVYIKGMEMPTHCIDCPFMVSRDGDDCILQSAEANANFENWEQMKACCPLVPVPPHGRLGDLDALRKRIEENIAAAKKAGNYEWRYACTVALDFALAAPTIIPKGLYRMR